MWKERKESNRRIREFFYYALSETSLGEYYSINFMLKQNYGWDLTYLESLVPWQRDMYVDMIIEWKEKAQNNN